MEAIYLVCGARGPQLMRDPLGVIPMAVRPDHFFIPTPFVRWALIPALLLFAVGMPLMMDEWTIGRILLMTALSGTAVLYAAALAWPSRLQWASRAVAGMVFVFYLIYTIHQWFFRMRHYYSTSQHLMLRLVTHY